MKKILAIMISAVFCTLTAKSDELWKAGFYAYGPNTETDFSIIHMNTGFNLAFNDTWFNFWEGGENQPAYSVEFINSGGGYLFGIDKCLWYADAGYKFTLSGTDRFAYINKLVFSVGIFGSESVGMYDVYQVWISKNGQRIHVIDSDRYTGNWTTGFQATNNPWDTSLMEISIPETLILPGEEIEIMILITADNGLCRDPLYFKGVTIEGKFLF